MVYCVTMKNLDSSIERKINTRSIGHSRRVNILRRGKSTRRSSSPAVTTTTKTKQRAAKRCEEISSGAENAVNDHLEEPMAILTTLGLTKVGDDMHLNSTQEEIISDDNKKVIIKDTAKSLNGEDEGHKEKMEEDTGETLCNDNNGIDSLVECSIDQDNDKMDVKLEDNSNPDITDESVLDCSVKNSPTTADTEIKDINKSEPKIKVKDNLLESKESHNIKLYENNSLVERMKLMEENNSLDGNGLISDEDNLMIDINPADVHVMQDDKDDKDSETSQDSVELRLTNRKNKRKPVKSLKDQEELHALAAKKFKRQVDQTFIRHDRIIKDYLQRTDNQSGNAKENIKYLMQHMEQIMNEIRSLNDLSRQKEQEWNELIHLQKAKEELLIRLSRKRDIMVMRMKMDEAKTAISDQNLFQMSNTNSSNYQSNSFNLTNILSKNMFQNLSSSISSNMMNGEGSNSCNATNKIDHQVNNLINNNSHNGLVVLPVNNINNANNMQSKIRMPPQAHSNNRIKNIPMNHFNNFGNLNHNQFMLNQQLNNPLNGRQGQVKDVKSIIADYRQRHPEAVPKRGRRMKSILQTNNGGSTDMTCDTNRLSELGLLLANEMQNSRPSSSESNDNMLLRNQSFQMNSNGSPLSLIQDISRSNDVTLHPITTNNEDTGKQQSLLHGILSKKSSRSSTSASDNSTPYSSTLARLLTAPERNSSSSTINTGSTLAERLSCNTNFRKVTKPANDLSKRRCTEEVTITPIDNPSTECNEIKKEAKEIDDQNLEVKAETCVAEEEAAEEEEDNPPACQGCNKSEAHYVCAGCANQWYCSRECQVNAWEVHSEVCKG